MERKGNFNSILTLLLILQRRIYMDDEHKVIHIELRVDGNSRGPGYKGKEYDYTLLVNNKGYLILKNIFKRHDKQYSGDGEWLLDDGRDLHEVVNKYFNTL